MGMEISTGTTKGGDEVKEGRGRKMGENEKKKREKAKLVQLIN